MFEFTAPPLSGTKNFIDEIKRIEKEVLDLYRELRIEVLFQSTGTDSWMAYASDLNKHAEQWLLEIEESEYHEHHDFSLIVRFLKQYIFISSNQELISNPIKTALFMEAKPIPPMVLIEEYASYATLTTNASGIILFDPVTLDYISNGIHFTIVPSLLRHILKEAKTDGIYHDFYRRFQARSSDSGQSV
jgi:hypothetical protein